MRTSQKYRLGLFMVASGILLVITLIMLAGGEFFRTEIKAFTTTSESVQGLDVGAPVKFRGVRVGRISDIRLHPHDLTVRVDMKFFAESIGLKNRQKLKKFLHQKIENGARARLELAGVTGNKYIGIDFYAEDPPKEAAVPSQYRESKRLFIPSVPSLMSGITSNFRYTLAEIADIDFKQIGQDLNSLLSSLNTYLEDERMNKILNNSNQAMRDIKDVSGRLQKQLEKAPLDQTTQRLNKTLKNADQLVTKLNKQVDQAALPELSKKADKVLTEYETLPGDIRKTVKPYRTLPEDIRKTVKETSGTLKEAKTLMQDVRQTLQKTKLPETSQQTRETLTTLRSDLANSLQRLNRTLSQLSSVANMLQQNPEMFIYGHSKSKNMPATKGEER